MKKIIFLVAVFVMLKPVAMAEDIGRVGMRGEFLNGDLLKIVVEMKDFSESVLGVAFNLKYDEALEFLKYEPGDFLEAGGDPFYLVQNNEVIVFGETLRRNDTFPDGSGDLVSFYFQIIEEKKFSFEFLRGVVSGMESVRQDLNEIVWEEFEIERKEVKKEFEVFKDGAKSNSLSSQINRLPQGVIKWLTWLLIIVALALFFARQLKYVNYK